MAAVLLAVAACVAIQPMSAAAVAQPRAHVSIPSTATTGEMIVATVKPNASATGAVAILEQLIGRRWTARAHCKLSSASTQALSLASPPQAGIVTLRVELARQGRVFWRSRHEEVAVSEAAGTKPAGLSPVSPVPSAPTPAAPAPATPQPPNPRPRSDARVRRDA